MQPWLGLYAGTATAALLAVGLSEANVAKRFRRDAAHELNEVAKRASAVESKLERAVDELKKSQASHDAALVQLKKSFLEESMALNQSDIAEHQHATRQASVTDSGVIEAMYVLERAVSKHGELIAGIAARCDRMQSDFNGKLNARSSEASLEQGMANMQIGDGRALKLL